ncbi:hypothetical protein M569_07910, partial [Genlisea aurea]
SLSSYSGVIKNSASKDGELRVFIVAGEVSGDIIASRFMKSLKELSPFPVRFAGIGGSMMLRQGLHSFSPMEDISVMGIWELLPYLSSFRMKLKETVESALIFRPHLVLTVDSKGFSFRFLKQLRARYAQHSPLHFHYVAPSFWAWKGGEARLEQLKDFIDHVFCILPFEEETCREKGLTATFVGHPTLEDALDLKTEECNEEWKIEGDPDEFRKIHGISVGSTLISLLPGSRLQEVVSMLPIFLRTVEQIKDVSELTAVVHVAPNKDVEEYISNSVCDWPVPVIMAPGGSLRLKYNAFSASRVALCASGTVAVELQMARLPCVVAYRAHPFTEWFIRYKAKIRHVSLPNILLDAPVIPEVLFRAACKPSNIAPLLEGLIQDEALRLKQMEAAEKFLPLLHP